MASIVGIAAVLKMIWSGSKYATLADTEHTNKKQGGRAKAKMTLSQARQQFKRTFSRKHHNKGRISKGTSKSKPTRTTKTKTGLRSIKHAVSSENKHELAEALKEIRAHESKQALNACLMLVPVFGMVAVIGMVAGGGSGGSSGAGSGGNEAKIREKNKEKLLRLRMEGFKGLMLRNGYHSNLNKCQMYTSYKSKLTEEKQKKQLDTDIKNYANLLNAHRQETGYAETTIDVNTHVLTITIKKNPTITRLHCVVNFNSDCTEINKNLHIQQRLSRLKSF